jgi:hypothetical protein
MITIDFIITGTWLGVRIFEDHRRVVVRGPGPSNAPRSHPIPHHGQEQPLSRERPIHSIPVPSHLLRVDRTASTRNETGTQGNLHTTPNESYQADAAAILARLRGEGVEFNDTPRRFNFAQDLVRPPSTATPRQAPAQTFRERMQNMVMRRRFLADAMRNMREGRQQTDLVSSARFVSDGNTVWSTAVSSDPAADFDTDLENDSGP